MEQEKELSSEEEIKEPPPCYSMVDLSLVYLHTFIYMFFYYGSIPGSKNQSLALGMEETITGVINACTPIGAGLSCFQYNWHTTHSYKVGYFVSYCFLLIGTFMMAISQTLESKVT